MTATSSGPAALQAVRLLAQVAASGRQLAGRGLDAEDEARGLAGLAVGEHPVVAEGDAEGAVPRHEPRHVLRGDEDPADLHARRGGGLAVHAHTLNGLPVTFSNAS